MTVTFDRKAAIALYWERVDKTRKQERIDNSSLHAGSPMYYYCRECGVHTETLPEGHWGRPKTLCDDCILLRDSGGIPTKR